MKGLHCGVGKLDFRNSPDRDIAQLVALGFLA